MGKRNYHTILVTGASGFIGSHLAKQLALKGYKVNAQYRRRNLPSGLFELKEGDISFLRADLLNKEACLKIVEKTDAVIHVAALASDWGSYSDFYKTNVIATQQLAEAALASGVHCFVYISSITVHGFGNHFDTKEEGPYYSLHHPYPLTKKIAEDYILALNSANFKTTVIRPGNVYGPGDTTTFYPMFKYIQKGFMGYVKKGRTLTCPIYIDDLIQAIILVLENAVAAGQIYNITSGEKVSWKELVDFLYRHLNPKKKPLSTPAWASLALAFLSCFFYKIIGSQTPPPLTVYRISQASHNYSFSIAKAEKELGFRPHTNWQTGMEKTIKAYLSQI